ncbi:MAG: hypothetical protein IPH16_21235 [Haliscomenobacter sp.]|nr:hypothetical protein [Haliscomenobacter sp.]
MLVAAISFADDVRTIRIRWRLAVQAAAFTLCFQELHVFEFVPVWQWPLLYLVCIGVVNAYNFMDGINGITGLYTLAVLIPLAIDAGGGFAAWQPDSPFPYLIAAVLAFGFSISAKKPYVLPATSAASASALRWFSSSSPVSWAYGRLARRSLLRLAPRRPPPTNGPSS